MVKSVELLYQSLKNKSDNQLKVSLYPAASEKYLKEFKKLGFPSDYVEFLALTNGMKLLDENSGMPKCHILGAEHVLSEHYQLEQYQLLFPNWKNLFPIIDLRDIGTIYIDLDRFQSGIDYLNYPDENPSYFDLSFSEWLRHYLSSGGEEFWYQD
ncbi:SMI1/KNR4 family protein [Streptococcus agalactiae]|nr:SMI1/KNR4 family protein [Streptococcus agalactiae]